MTIGTIYSFWLKVHVSRSIIIKEKNTLMSIKWEKRLPNHCCIFLEVTRLILTLFRCSSMAEFNQYSWWARWRGFRISRLHHDTDQQGTFSYIICSFCWGGGKVNTFTLTITSNVLLQYKRFWFLLGCSSHTQSPRSRNNSWHLHSL